MDYILYRRVQCFIFVAKKTKSIQTKKKTKAISKSSTHHLITSECSIILRNQKLTVKNLRDLNIKNISKPIELGLKSPRKIRDRQFVGRKSDCTSNKLLVKHKSVNKVHMAKKRTDSRPLQRTGGVTFAKKQTNSHKRKSRFTKNEFESHLNIPSKKRVKRLISYEEYKRTLVKPKLPFQQEGLSSKNYIQVCALIVNIDYSSISYAD